MWEGAAVSPFSAACAGLRRLARTWRARCSLRRRASRSCSAAALFSASALR
jgi:hypothetical protein